MRDYENSTDFVKGCFDCKVVVTPSGLCFVIKSKEVK